MMNDSSRKHLKIPKEESEAVIRNTDNIIDKGGIRSRNTKYRQYNGQRRNQKP